jgi:uncharacterized protein YbjT (DUF2867 family)
MQRKILITGATGNVGASVVRHLSTLYPQELISIACRQTSEAQTAFSDLASLDVRAFDFEHPAPGAFDQIDTVFLLRPPHISDVQRYFAPLVAQMKTEGVRNIVFFSVQGAEKSRIIPHHKIEKLIRASGLKYIFVRPGYFMQNLTTTLLKDIREHQTIYLPAGRAKFMWTDVENIGELVAIFLADFDRFANRAIEVTGSDLEDFYYASAVLSEMLKTKIRFVSSALPAFFFRKKREGVPTAFTFVMIMLHFLPRFTAAPRVSPVYQEVTGKKPTSLRQFIEREKNKFTK